MRYFVLLIGMGALCGPGCARTTPDQIAEPVVPVRESLTSIPAQASLTSSEVSLFLRVVQQLPDQQPPEFVESELESLRGTRQLDQSVERMRESIRKAITAERQVGEWEQQLPLKRAFDSLNVDPLQFARLMLKISCAWSAWQIRQERPLTEAREQLDARIAQLIQQARQIPEAGNPLEETELLEVLEELIVLSEFLRLLEQVPEENLNVVAQARLELKHVLPASSLREEFARYLDSQTRILRASYLTP